MFIGDTHQSVDQLAVDPGAQLDRCAVRAQEDSIPGRDPASLRVLVRELGLALGALELELANALDRRSGQEWVSAPSGSPRPAAGRRCMSMLTVAPAKLSLSNTARSSARSRSNSRAVANWR